MNIISDIWNYAWPFLVTISVIVFVHELGHYLVARANGVRVEVFSIGFGPELFGVRDRHGTRWKLSLLPLGGYVKFFGDANAASGAKDGQTLAALGDEDRRVSFHHKRVGQRAAVVLGGPLGNFVFAAIVFAFLFGTIGEPKLSDGADVGGVVSGQPAQAAGLLAGDKVLSVNGQPVVLFEDLQRVIQQSAGAPLAMTVLRGESELQLTVTPQRREERDEQGNPRDAWRIGVERAVVFTPVGPARGIWLAIEQTYSVAYETLRAVGQMISGARSTEELGGPIQIGKMSGDIAQEGSFRKLIYFLAVLSINLGLINLFPVPMLDGGHLIFYIWEAIAGRPLKPRVQEYGMRVGFVLVIALMVWVTSKDLIRIGLLDLF